MSDRFKFGEVRLNKKTKWLFIDVEKRGAYWYKKSQGDVPEKVVLSDAEGHVDLRKYTRVYEGDNPKFYECVLESPDYPDKNKKLKPVIFSLPSADETAAYVSFLQGAIDAAANKKKVDLKLEESRVETYEKAVEEQKTPRSTAAEEARAKAAMDQLAYKAKVRMEEARRAKEAAESVDAEAMAEYEKELHQKKEGGVEIEGKADEE
eukprot:CAMPEP_0170742360 /NCGR_PEP_ID=MMETSP0437-20130122/6702_1 /TAXON_ID=0 /ORGANISM="Sexangularia sp." /LENGTH=206 /DNA_ID=CAMNT_0011080975 /DNA_START=54 /DNA_END=674 /DNA_ORIENTATION=-